MQRETTLKIGKVVVLTILYIVFSLILGYIAQHGLSFLELEWWQYYVGVAILYGMSFASHLLGTPCPICKLGGKKHKH